MVLGHKLNTHEFVSREFLMHLVEYLQVHNRETVGHTAILVEEGHHPTGQVDILERRGRCRLRQEAGDVVVILDELVVIGIVHRVGRPIAESGLGCLTKAVDHCPQHATPKLRDLLGIRLVALIFLGRNAAEPAANRAPVRELVGHNRMGNIRSRNPELAHSTRNLAFPPDMELGIDLRRPAMITKLVTMFEHAVDILRPHLRERPLRLFNRVAVLPVFPAEQGQHQVRIDIDAICLGIADQVMHVLRQALAELRICHQTFHEPLDMRQDMQLFG